MAPRLVESNFAGGTGMDRAALVRKTTWEPTMLDEPRRKRQPPDLETNTTPDQLHDDLRRRDQQTPPDSMPPSNEEGTSAAAGGGFTPKLDGGNEQHPIHDEDEEDATSADYEREIDRLDEAVRARSR
jgi:hypothetical protein